MVLVTACLIFKWIHQKLSSEQSTEQTTKITTKTWEQKVSNEKIYQFNNKYSRTEEFAYKELESVKAVLQIRNEELARLRTQMELLREERREERRKSEQEDKQTQTRSNVQEERGRPD